jgi:four helix bundle suffix protein
MNTSAPSEIPSPILPPHGGYRQLKSFQVAECLYDGTVIFCDRFDSYDPYGIATASPEVAANTLLCLCNQATYLLKRQIARQERDFAQEGGITERLYRRRVEARAKSDRSDQSDKAPACPQCGKPMRRRTARQGPRAGQPFWGCSAYPDCRGIVPIPPPPSNQSDRSAPSDNPPRPRP